MVERVLFVLLFLALSSVPQQASSQTDPPRERVLSTILRADSAGDLPSGFIKRVVIHEGVAYLGTARGLGRFTLADEAFLPPITEADGLPGRYINDLKLRGSRLLLATNQGIATFDLESETVSRPQAAAGLEIYELTALAADQRSTVLGSPYFGFMIQSLERGQSRTLTLDDGLASNEVFDVALTERDLFIATARGLHRLRRADNAMVHFAPESQYAPSTSTAVIAAFDSVWVATESEGLLRLNPFSNTFELVLLIEEPIRRLVKAGQRLFVFTRQDVLEYDAFTQSADSWLSTLELPTQSYGDVAFEGNRAVLVTDEFEGGLNLVETDTPRIEVETIRYSQSDIQIAVRVDNLSGEAELSARLANATGDDLGAESATLEGPDQSEHTFQLRYPEAGLPRTRWQINLAVDQGGTLTSDSFWIPVSTREPEVSVRELPLGIRENPLRLVATLGSDLPLEETTLTLNGQSQVVWPDLVTGEIRLPVSLSREGLNRLELQATNLAGFVATRAGGVVYEPSSPMLLSPDAASTIEAAADAVPLELQLSQRTLRDIRLNPGNVPLLRGYPNDEGTAWTLEALDSEQVTVSILENDTAPVAMQLSFEDLELNEPEVITITSVSAAGQVLESEFTLIRRPSRPVISLHPETRYVTPETQVTLRVTTEWSQPIRRFQLVEPALELPIAGNGEYVGVSLNLEEGENRLRFRAEDINGVAGELTVSIVQDPDFIILDEVVGVEFESSEELAAEVVRLRQRVRDMQQTLDNPELADSLQRRLEAIARPQATRVIVRGPAADPRRCNRNDVYVCRISLAGAESWEGAAGMIYDRADYASVLRRFNGGAVQDTVLAPTLTFLSRVHASGFRSQLEAYLRYWMRAGGGPTTAAQARAAARHLGLSVQQSGGSTTLQGTVIAGSQLLRVVPSGDGFRIEGQL